MEHQKSQKRTVKRFKAIQNQKTYRDKALVFWTSLWGYQMP